MQQGEIEFPFSIKGFTKQVEKMSDSVGKVEKKMDSFGKTMTKSVAKGVTSVVAKIGLLVKGFQSVMKNMPEIGQAFKIASSIMTKEFFFPIRQFIMPYLQKMLDWTRDHRTMFAKWGTAVVDILKVVTGVAKQLWDVFKHIAEILTNSLQKGLGTSFKSLDEFVNVLSVKISVVTLLVGDAVKAMFDKIAPTLGYVIEKGTEILEFFGDLASSWASLNKDGVSIGTVLEKMWDIFDKIVHIIGDSLGAFFEGLIEPLKDLMTPLDKIMDSFERLLSIFGNDNSGLKGMFKWLGNFVGNVLMVAFNGLAIALDTIVTAIQTLVQSGSLIKDLFTGDWDSLSKDWDKVKNLWSAYGERTAGTFGDIKKNAKGAIGINDGIVTKDGQVIKLNPQDNIYAFKGKPIGGVNANMSMVFNVTVTEGNAQNAGQMLGNAIYKSFSDKLREQQLAGGW